MMKKGILSFLLIFSILLGFSIPAQAAGMDFTDVAADAWYADAVAYCRNNGIMAGTSDTRFTPQGTTSRAMMATVLWNMDGKQTATGAVPFSDVQSGMWYTDAIRWAVKSNIISGYNSTTFGTNDPVTREQIAAMFYRYEEYKNGQPATSKALGFSDASTVSTWARPAVAWAADQKTVSGKPGNIFDPRTGATRAEVATMIHRYATRTNNPEKPDANRVLVAYFSRTGSTEQIANLIHNELGGEIFKIETTTQYNGSYDDVLAQAQAEQRSNARPPMATHISNMNNYDVVFIGYPIWWGDTPMAVLTFLEEYDLSGKTVIPFCTYGSGGAGRSYNSIATAASDATVLDGFSCRGSDAGRASSDVSKWINGLDIQTSSSQNVGVFNFNTKTVLLNSGYEMPILGLGTYSLSDEACFNSVTALLQAGGRLIDTAYMYHNEESVGRAVRESNVPREEIFVITKLYPSQFNNAETAIEEALKKLDIGYIDMMLLHHPGSNDVAAYKAMEKAVADGKIRSIGLSNWYVEELETFLPQVSITPALVQNEIHPYYQENEVIPYIQNLGIVVQGWYPLGGRGHTAALLNNEVISGIARSHGVSSAQVILRWNLQKGVVVIPGSSNPNHIRENLSLFDFELTDAEMNQINALDRNEKHDWY